MFYCVKCDWVHDNDEKCTVCGELPVSIKSPKLIELANELNEAITFMSERTIISNPKRIIDIAKTIEKGEKKLQKEMTKRLEEVTAIQHELLVINNIANRMGYTINNAQLVSTDEPEPELTPEPQQEGEPDAE